MAHNVETMAYVGEVPWHGLGKAIPENCNSEQMLVHAGLNWGVTREPVIVGQNEVRGYKGIVRDSDGRVLSIMGDKYKPHSNAECFDFFDTLVGSKEAIYHTAGSLSGGRKTWVLAQLPGDIRVGGTDDVVKKFLLLATSFDGSLATIAKLTPTRVVCNNTLNEAVRGKGTFIKFSHRSTLESKVVEAQKVLGFAKEAYFSFEKSVNKFAAARFSEKAMKGLAEVLFPANDEGEVSGKAEEARDLLVNLYENGKGQEMCRGTAWAAFNAVTEFTDHYRSTRVTEKAESEADTRLNSVWFGASANMKHDAFAYIDQAIDAAVPGVIYTAP